MLERPKALGAGVYMIYCHENEKAYIGSSNRVNRRFNHHRCYLRAGKHGNRHLQNAWNLYGEDSFSMGMIHACEDGEQLELEQYYLDIWFESGMTFNRRPDAKSPAGVKWTDAEREAKSIAMKANPPFKGRNHSEASKALISTQAKDRMSDPANNPFFGKKHTSESKAKISRANAGNKSCVGRVTTEKCKAAVAEANRRRVFSAETLAKLSAATSGSNNPRFGVKVSLATIEKRKGTLARNKALSLNKCQ